MHDHTGGDTSTRRFTRRGLRATAALGAGALLAGGLAVSTAAAAQATHTTKTVLACEVTDTGGINDHSFNASAYAGMLLAAKHAPKGVKINTKFASSKQTSDYVKYINGFVAAKCSIVVTVGFLMTDATWNAAVKNPKVHFSIVRAKPARPGSSCSGDPT